MTLEGMKIIEGDCRGVLATLPEQHYHCCVTSPPYFGLRDYGVDGQIGLEESPQAFVDEMVQVFPGRASRAAKRRRPLVEPRRQLRGERAGRLSRRQERD